MIYTTLRYNYASLDMKVSSLLYPSIHRISSHSVSFLHQPASQPGYLLTNYLLRKNPKRRMDDMERALFFSLLLP